MGRQVLVLVQESRTAFDWPAELGRDWLQAIVDQVAEGFEQEMTTIAAGGYYSSIVRLVDVDCTFEKMATTLLSLTQEGATIDLVVLGHGSEDSLVFHDDVSVTDPMIRALKVRAEDLGLTQLNLRMVYMCNCVGSSLNDAWRYVGARASVGTAGNNYMPEPTTTVFLARWARDGRSVLGAAADAYGAANAFYWSLPVPNPLLGGIATPGIIGIAYQAAGWFDSSRLVVEGDVDVTRDFVHAGAPLLDPAITNPPPFLARVLVAKGRPGLTPIDFGRLPLPGDGVSPPVVKYDRRWSATPVIRHLEDGQPKPPQPLLGDPDRGMAYLFLRFGPERAGGRPTRMRAVTASARWTATDGVVRDLAVPLTKAGGDEAEYWWGTFAPPQHSSSSPLAVRLEVLGADAEAHATGRLPVGDQLDAEPSSVATVSLRRPYPFTGYTQGTDRTHEVRVCPLRGNDSAANTTAPGELVVFHDTVSYTGAWQAHRVLRGAGDADHYLVSFPVGEGGDAPWSNGSGHIGFVYQPAELRIAPVLDPEDAWRPLDVEVKVGATVLTPGADGAYTHESFQDPNHVASQAQVSVVIRDPAARRVGYDLDIAWQGPRWHLVPPVDEPVAELERPWEWWRPELELGEDVTRQPWDTSLEGLLHKVVDDITARRPGGDLAVAQEAAVLRDARQVAQEAHEADAVRYVDATLTSLDAPIVRPRPTPRDRTVGPIG